MANEDTKCSMMTRLSVPGPISEISDRGEGEGEDATIHNIQERAISRVETVSGVRHKS